VRDYAALGLRVGLEIHAQLDTGKLFCHCASDLVDTHDAAIIRRLRPTMSELGEIDPAAREEFKKGVMHEYRASLGHACLVYADEEPPHDPNPEAVHTLLQIALLLDAVVVDSIHFMRKIVIDGSNVSGFQRTALVALDGVAHSAYGTVRIPTICLGEGRRAAGGDEGAEPRLEHRSARDPALSRLPPTRPCTTPARRGTWRLFLGRP
jgi:glutamyl-tRNA(Gln) amidotransferase subunit E